MSAYRGGPYRGGSHRGGAPGGQRGRGGYGAGRGQFHTGPDRAGGAPQPRIYREGQVPAPDARVQQQEDAVAKAISDPARALTQLSLTSDRRQPLRPGYGVRGENVTLWANYFELHLSPKTMIYTYQITTLPDLTKKSRKLAQLIRLMLDSPQLNAMKDGLATDYRSTIVSCQKLQDQQCDFDIQYRGEREDPPSGPPRSADKHRIRLEPTHTFPANDLLQYLVSTELNMEAETLKAIVQALNILLKHQAKSSEDMTTVGKNKIFSLREATKTDLGQGLHGIRGFFSSVRLATRRCLVNVNVSHGAFFDGLPLEQLMFKLRLTTGENMYLLSTLIKELRVRTTHRPKRVNNNGQEILRIKTIYGLATLKDGTDPKEKVSFPPKVAYQGAGSDAVQFWKSESRESTKGTYTTVTEHFEQAYKRKIANPKMPVLNVGSLKRPEYLPAEVCVALEGEPFRKKLSGDQTARMIKFAVRQPCDNATTIVNEGFQTVGLDSTKNPILRRFETEVSSSLITVPGRVLKAPKITYKGSISLAEFGTWNLVNRQFTKGSTLKQWSLLVLERAGIPSTYRPDAPTAIFKKFRDQLKLMGVTASDFQEPMVVKFQNLDDSIIADTLTRAAKVFDLLLVVLPSDDSKLYSKLKRLADVELGLHTVCCVAKNLFKGDGHPQYIANVAMKINLKLGGVNHYLDKEPCLNIISSDKTMVVGIDVTHPSPGSKEGAPSVAGMVASVDKLLGQWPAILRIQDKNKKEMVSDLCEMLKTRLDLWRTMGKHAEYPENILVYRDGVSDGQFELVLENELPLLRQACAEKYGPKQKQPKITIAVAGKRHQTRFYPTDSKKADKFLNPKPGTVVDRGVTQAVNWDFYIQPHAAITGTARPLYYHVIFDEIFKSMKVPAGYANHAELFQDMTHKFCFLYGRATKAVSLCPPVYYADIVCERARKYLNEIFEGDSASTSTQTPTVTNAMITVHPKLRDTMFYI